MATLLVVSHSRAGGTAKLRDAVLAGIGTAVEEMGNPEALTLRSLECADAGPDDVRWADLVVLGCPERFGYMAGLMKDFLERIYYEILDETHGKPWALFVKAGNDGSGAVRSIERIVTGLQWSQVLPPVVAVGDVTSEHTDAAWELGATVAAGLLSDLY